MGDAWAPGVTGPFSGGQGHVPRTVSPQRPEPPGQAQERWSMLKRSPTKWSSSPRLPSSAAKDLDLHSGLLSCRVGFVSFTDDETGNPCSSEHVSLMGSSSRCGRIFGHRLGSCRGFTSAGLVQSRIPSCQEQISGQRCNTSQQTDTWLLRPTLQTPTEPL